MDLTKEALEFIQQSAPPNIIEHNKRKYSDKQLHIIPNWAYPNTLEVSTLSSLVEYVLSEIDSLFTETVNMLIVVESPTKVSLMSSLDSDAKREKLLTAEAILPRIELDHFVERERFQIALQSQFTDSEDRTLLLEFMSRVKAGTTAEYGDDGVSQKVTINMGASGLQDTTVPNPVTLFPYRTFIDIPQPESRFVFRLKDDGNRTYCALFEADGGAWKIPAVEDIKDYLNKSFEHLEDPPVVIG